MLRDICSLVGVAAEELNGYVKLNMNNFIKVIHHGGLGSAIEPILAIVGLDVGYTLDRSV